MTAVLSVEAPNWEEWTCRLERGKKRAFVADHGKPSKTLARRVAAIAGGPGGGHPSAGQPGAGRPNLAQWELVPVTGRPHQLRFEMARHGCPIFGDVLYGGATAGRPDWIALRAVELDLRAVKDRLGLPDIVRVSGATLLEQS